MRIGTVNYLLIYGITASVFFVIDMLWLGWVARGFYAKHLGGLLRDQVNWIAALIFYLLYIGGILVFVITPALKNGSGVLQVALTGGLLGLFAYGTFDLTALALLKNWPANVATVDILWGTLLTAGTSAMSLWIFQSLVRSS